MMKLKVLLCRIYFIYKSIK